MNFFQRNNLQFIAIIVFLNWQIVYAPKLAEGEKKHPAVRAIDHCKGILELNDLPAKITQYTASEYKPANPEHYDFYKDVVDSFIKYVKAILFAKEQLTQNNSDHVDECNIPFEYCVCVDYLFEENFTGRKKDYKKEVWNPYDADLIEKYKSFLLNRYNLNEDVKKNYEYTSSEEDEDVIDVTDEEYNNIFYEDDTEELGEFTADEEGIDYYHLHTHEDIEDIDLEPMTNNLKVEEEDDRNNIQDFCIQHLIDNSALCG